uniref:Mei2-like C-terminal RNA recognition motif domain-containing protein n=1 Tax=Alexandrium monilatum TaxID=311494 RepID=A0A6T1KAU3_9DINO
MQNPTMPRQAVSFWSPPGVGKMKPGKSANNSSGSLCGLTAQQPPTTIMVSNIPKEIAHRNVLAEIRANGFAGRFDLVYLTSWKNSKKARNFGYGFINFLSARDAARFMDMFAGYMFEGAANSPDGVLVQPARVQGFVASVRRLAEAEQQHGLKGFVLCVA